MEVSFVVFAILAFVGFRQWLAYKRRELAHRERLAAIEKGVPVPAVEPEPVADRRRNSIERRYLFGGLMWTFSGVAVFLFVAALGNSEAMRNDPEPMPPEFALIGLIPVAFGFAHLGMYFVEKRIARRNLERGDAS